MFEKIVVSGVEISKSINVVYIVLGQQNFLFVVNLIVEEVSIDVVEIIMTIMIV